MPELTLPVERFKDAGATDDEIEALQSEFDHSDIGVQRSLVAEYAGAPKSLLIEKLANLRSAGHFDQSDEDDDTGEGDGPHTNDSGDVSGNAGTPGEGESTLEE